MKSVFITGVSRGFGQALARKFLAEGYQVYGCSRTPPDMLHHPCFHWGAVDMSRPEPLAAELEALFTQWRCDTFDLVVLNAGMFGPSPRKASDISLGEFQTVLNVNLIANKIILDLLLSRFSIKQCLFCASIAGVRLRAGTLAYGVSKAALNAMAQVYASENPQSFFAVLGLCNMQTDLLKNALDGPHVRDFPEICALRDRATSEGYVTPATQRAEQVWDLFDGGLHKYLVSGQFKEIRTLTDQ
ncbi:SDR family oxidoreductase [Pseudomonas sp. OA65]|uniref:SDR family NAD(P)-dependent oxidoreductase n=1 Tax=Pseudomonas sp. OA65 TaxID=2818431 RepID=UPI001A9EA5FD|nr:SDR family oxidoreductase [Pseudomonas sp. OA65]MBO1540732.1 SDR family oxidoreductase [Pseudomonas sp. OA65]